MGLISRLQLQNRGSAQVCAPLGHSLIYRHINAFEHRLTIYVLKLAFIISLCLGIAFCNTTCNKLQLLTYQLITYYVLFPVSYLEMTKQIFKTTPVICVERLRTAWRTC